MAQVPYPGVLKVVCTQQIINEISVNVWHCIYTPPGGGDFDLADRVANVFAAFYGPGTVSPNTGTATLRPTHAVLVEVSVQDLSNVPYPPAVKNSQNVAGGGGASYPMETAIVGSLRTVAATRRGRGRIYLGPVAATTSTGGTGTTPLQVSTTAKNMVVQAIVDLNTRLKALTPTPVRLAVLSPADGIARAVTRAVCDANYDTQRRRSNDMPYAGPSTQPLT